MDQLSAPAAAERAEAINRIAAWPGDISADLRVAYKFATNLERAGLFHAAVKRNDGALVQAAAGALTEADTRVSLSARDYLLALPAGQLNVDTSLLEEEQQDEWHAFQLLRLRRDIARVLLDAYLKPGKYFGQFDELRRRDSGALDRELLNLLFSHSDFREPLHLAAQQRVDQGIDPARMFSNQWRLLTDAAPAFRSAVGYFAQGELSDEVTRQLGNYSMARLQSALSVLCDLRANAVRALSYTDAPDVVAPRLLEAHRAISDFSAAPALRSSINADGMKSELEVALARFDLPELLNARIDGLRRHVQRAQESPAHVNARNAPRPDLIAQNEIAQLLLRSGDTAAAEREYLAAIENTTALLRESNPRSRNTLVSYLAAAYYNLACAQGLQLKTMRAVESLKAAVEYGYRDFTWMLEDGDLTHVRRAPEFAVWFEDVAPPAVLDVFKRGN
ncbi:MAG: hypothetical protein KF696_13150 [Planctomycetes bacterium]|nr:hypothetical protein [Planctomycetota bacterium]MCW8135504.1 hypothetical protein [Planctomycetota bacterium]